MGKGKLRTEIELVGFEPVIPSNLSTVEREEYVPSWWINKSKSEPIQISTNPSNNNLHISYGVQEFSRTVFDGVIETGEQLKMVLKMIGYEN